MRGNQSPAFVISTATRPVSALSAELGLGRPGRNASGPAGSQQRSKAQGPRSRHAGRSTQGDSAVERSRHQRLAPSNERPRRCDVSGSDCPMNPDAREHHTTTGVAPRTDASGSVDGPFPRARVGREAEAMTPSARTIAFGGGCCINPWRARWIASNGGLRKPPSRPSRADRPSRGRRAQLLWRALARARCGFSETALCNSHRPLR